MVILPDWHFFNGDVMSTVEYRSMKPNLSITLESTVRTIVGNKQHVKRGRRVQFHNHVFRTDNQEIINRLDSMLAGPRAVKWNYYYQKVPSKEAIKKWSEAAKKAKDAADKIMKESMADGKAAEFERFDSFLKRTKSAQPQTIAGMRSIGK